MEISVRYFGQLAEVTHKSEESIDTNAPTIMALREELVEKYPALSNRSFQLAQNNQIVAEATPLSAEIVDLLPPFSGG